MMIVTDRIESANNILYVLTTDDGFSIETVYSKKARCQCVSTQIGCATGCKFCASGMGPFYRNLSVDEIKQEFECVQKEQNEITTIHFGGVGEPLRNINNVLLATKIIPVNDFQITTSVPNERSFHVMLKGQFNRIIISLHSLEDSIRKNLIPNSLSASDIVCLLRNSLQQYPQLRDKMRISYLQLGEINTTEQEQERFIKLARELNVKLLLQSYNPIVERQEFSTIPERCAVLLDLAQRNSIGVDNCLFSASRTDSVGGCGTLTAKYNRKQLRPT